MFILILIIFVDGNTDNVLNDGSIGMSYNLWLVAIRLCTVVISATCLISLTTRATEEKNKIQFEDLILIQRLQESAENLLCSILPRTANKGLASLLGLSHLTGNGLPTLVIEMCPGTTVIESDLVGSTALAATLAPLDVCIMLHDLYTRWDSLANERGRGGNIVKITTIGDAYIAVAGPSFDDFDVEEEKNSNDLLNGKQRGALAAVRMACSMLVEAAKVKAVRRGHEKKSTSSTQADTEIPMERSIQIRIGCATGDIYGAVLGVRQFQWQVWGPALSDATKYEETGRPGEVHISQNTCKYAREAIATTSLQGQCFAPPLIFEAEEQLRQENSEKEDDDADEFSRGFYVTYQENT